MNNEDLNDIPTSQNAKPVGDAWVACKSTKFIPGRSYYFNTITKEAVWDLSFSEMEKAKKKSRFQGNEGNVENVSYPEPENPPKHGNSSRRPDNTYKSFPTISTTQMIPTPCTFNPFVPSPNHCSGLQMMAAPSSTSLSISSNTTYNPNVWTVPPTHQIFIAPTGPSLTDLSIPQNTVPYNTFQIINRPYVRNFRKYIPNRKNNYRNSFRNGFRRNLINQQDFTDLRERLTRKRSYSQGSTFDWHDPEDICQPEDSEQVSEELTSPPDYTSEEINEKRIKKETIHEESDEKWLEDNLGVTGTTMSLDINPLKQLCKVVNVNETWYIVANTDVLLDNLQFVSNLVNADKDCHLAVAQFVLSELETVGRVCTPQLKERARRAACLLQQLQEASSMLIGDDKIDISINKNEILLDLCLQLISQNYFVVLLSNDETLQKENTNIPIFSVIKMKQFLERQTNQKMRSLENIQVIVPNIRHNSSAESEPRNSVSPTTFPSTTKDSEVQNSLMDITSTSRTCIVDKCINTQRDTSEPLKSSISVEVQTDFDIIDRVGTKTPPPSSDSHKPSNAIQNNHLDKNLQQSNSATNNSYKVREIKLKRNVINTETSNSKDENKKHFKWRKRRTNTNTTNNTKLITISSSAQNSSKNEITESNSTNKENLLNNNLKTNENRSRDCYDENTLKSNDNSTETESCPSVIVQRVPSEGITIEESSTSGIISNTVSNADTESITSMSRNQNDFNESGNTILNEKLMFKITNRDMEECIIKGKDEWVSRFVQIMEEVLTQILNRNPAFHDPKMPPPWTFHEATICIKSKFVNNPDVVEMADMLCKMLCNIGEDKGKISSITPSQYIELYSYGIHLVDALQSVDDCEDLQTAADLLTGLLINIQEASSNIVIDFPEDEIDETSIKISENSNTGSQDLTEEVVPYRPAINEEDNIVETLQNIQSQNTEVEVTKYNLRCRKNSDSDKQSSVDLEDKSSKDCHENIEVENKEVPKKHIRKRRISITATPDKTEHFPEFVRAQNEIKQYENIPKRLLRQKRAIPAVPKDTESHDKVPALDNENKNMPRKLLRKKRNTSANDDNINVNTNNIQSLNENFVPENEQLGAVIQVNTPKKKGRSRKNVVINTSKSQDKKVENNTNDKDYTPIDTVQENNDSVTPEVKFIRKINEQSNFLSFLKLKKNNSYDKIENNNASCTNKVTDDSNKTDNIQKNDEKQKETATVESEPKIIRKFTAFAAFEEKLKKKKQREYLNLNALDYYGDMNNDDDTAAQGQDNFHENHDSYTDNLDYIDTQNSHTIHPETSNEDQEEIDGNNSYSEDVDENQDDYDENMDGYDENQYGCDENQDDYNEYIEESNYDYEMQNEQNDNVKRVFSTFIDCIKESYKNIHSFCIKVESDIQNNDEFKNKNSSREESKIQETTENTITQLESICKNLNSMLDPTTESQRLKLLLSTVGLENVTLNTKQFEQYRQLLKICLIEGKKLLLILSYILDIIKS